MASTRKQNKLQNLKRQSGQQSVGDDKDYLQQLDKRLQIVKDSILQGIVHGIQVEMRRTASSMKLDQTLIDPMISQLIEGIQEGMDDEIKKLLKESNRNIESQIDKFGDRVEKSLEPLSSLTSLKPIVGAVPNVVNDTTSTTANTTNSTVNQSDQTTSQINNSISAAPAITKPISTDNKVQSILAGRESKLLSTKFEKPGTTWKDRTKNILKSGVMNAVGLGEAYDFKKQRQQEQSDYVESQRQLRPDQTEQDLKKEWEVRESYKDNLEVADAKFQDIKSTGDYTPEQLSKLDISKERDMWAGFIQPDIPAPADIPAATAIPVAATTEATPTAITAATVPAIPPAAVPAATVPAIPPADIPAATVPAIPPADIPADMATPPADTVPAIPPADIPAATAIPPADISAATAIPSVDAVPSILAPAVIPPIATLPAPVATPVSEKTATVSANTISTPAADITVPSAAIPPTTPVTASTTVPVPPATNNISTTASNLTVNNSTNTPATAIAPAVLANLAPAAPAALGNSAAGILQSVSVPSTPSNPITTPDLINQQNTSLTSLLSPPSEEVKVEQEKQQADVFSEVQSQSQVEMEQLDQSKEQTKTLIEIRDLLKEGGGVAAGGGGGDSGGLGLTDVIDALPGKGLLKKAGGAVSRGASAVGKFATSAGGLKALKIGGAALAVGTGAYTAYKGYTGAEEDRAAAAADIEKKIASGEITKEEGATQLKAVEEGATEKKGGALGEGTGMAAGGVAGLKAGMALGTFLGGPVGTVVGGALGSITGAFLGSSAGKTVGEYAGKGVNYIKNAVGIGSPAAKQDQTTPAGTPADVRDTFGRTTQEIEKLYKEGKITTEEYTTSIRDIKSQQAVSPTLIPGNALQSNLSAGGNVPVVAPSSSAPPVNTPPTGAKSPDAARPSWTDRLKSAIGTAAPVLGVTGLAGSALMSTDAGKAVGSTVGKGVDWLKSAVGMGPPETKVSAPAGGATNTTSTTALTETKDTFGRTKTDLEKLYKEGKITTEEYTTSMRDIQSVSTQITSSTSQPTSAGSINNTPAVLSSAPGASQRIVVAGPSATTSQLATGNIPAATSSQPSWTDRLKSAIGTAAPALGVAGAAGSAVMNTDAGKAVGSTVSKGVDWLKSVVGSSPSATAEGVQGTTRKDSSVESLSIANIQTKDTFGRSTEELEKLYKEGKITREDYTTSLRDIKSQQVTSNAAPVPAPANLIDKKMAVTNVPPTALSNRLPDTTSVEAAAAMGKNIAITSPAPTVVPMPSQQQVVQQPFAEKIRNTENTMQSYVRMRYVG